MQPSPVARPELTTLASPPCLTASQSLPKQITLWLVAFLNPPRSCCLHPPPPRFCLSAAVAQLGVNAVTLVGHIGIVIRCARFPLLADCSQEIHHAFEGIES